MKNFRTEGRNCKKVIPVINSGGSNSLKSIKIKPVAKIKRREFENAKVQLMQRADNIAGQLSSVGIKSEQLTTREVVQLFYDIY